MPCPRCGVAGPVRLAPGEVCAACAAELAWTQAEGEKLVIRHADVDAAIRRGNPRRPILDAVLAGLAVTAAAAALAMIGSLHAARAVGPLDSLVGSYARDSRGAALAGGAAVVLAALSLWRQRTRRRRLTLVPALAALVIGIGTSALGAAGWRSVSALDFDFTTMPPPPRGWPPAFERIRRATVSVVAPDEDGDARTPAIGVGAVVRAAGGRAYIVTCSHVAMPYAAVASFRDAARAHPVWVQFADGRSSPARVVWTAQPPLDVALLEAETDGAPAPVDIADDTTELVADTAVLFVPQPYRHGWIVHRGAVQRRQLHRTPAGEVDLLYTDLPVFPGDSGSGLYDGSGRLVGLNTWTRFGPGAPQGISLPAETLRALVEAMP